jgi:hypothetical protein
MGFDFERGLQSLKAFSQLVDLNVDDLGSGIKIVSPDFRQNVLAVQHLFPEVNQKCQEPALGGFQLKVVIMKAHHVLLNA